MSEFPSDDQEGAKEAAGVDESQAKRSLPGVEETREQLHSVASPHALSRGELHRIFEMAGELLEAMRPVEDADDFNILLTVLTDLNYDVNDIQDSGIPRAGDHVRRHIVCLIEAMETLEKLTGEGNDFYASVKPRLGVFISTVKGLLAGTV